MSTTAPTMATQDPAAPPAPHPGAEALAVPSRGWLRACAGCALASAAACALGALPWYLATFPGRATLDTMDQLFQAAGRWPLNNYHPVALALLFKAFRLNMVAYGLVQYALLSLTLGGALALAATGFSTRRSPGIAAPVVLGLLLGLAPQLGSFVAFFDKDVPYLIMELVALCALALALEEVRRPSLGMAAGLGLLSGLPWLFRHDGALPAGLMLLATLAFGRRRWTGARRWAPGYLAGLVAATALRFAVPTLVGADEGNARWAYSVAFVQDLAGVLAHGGRVDAQDLAFIRRFADPARLVTDYNAAYGDTLYHGKNIVDRDALANRKGEFFRGYLRVIAKNPRILLEQRLDRFGHQLGLTPITVHGPLLENPPTPFGIEARPLAFAGPARKVMAWTELTTAGRLLFYCTLWPLLALLMAGAWAVYRGAPGVAAFCWVPALNVPLFAVVSHASTYRYYLYMLPFAVVAVLAALTRAPAAHREPPPLS